EEGVKLINNIFMLSTIICGREQLVTLINKPRYSIKTEDIVKQFDLEKESIKKYKTINMDIFHTIYHFETVIPARYFSLIRNSILWNDYSLLDQHLLLMKKEDINKTEEFFKIKPWILREATILDYLRTLSNLYPEVGKELREFVTGIAKLILENQELDEARRRYQLERFLTESLSIIGTILNIIDNKSVFAPLFYEMKDGIEPQIMALYRGENRATSFIISMKPGREKLIITGRIRDDDPLVTALLLHKLFNEFPLLHRLSTTNCDRIAYYAATTKLFSKEIIKKLEEIGIKAVPFTSLRKPEELLINRNMLLIGLAISKKLGRILSRRNLSKYELFFEEIASLPSRDIYVYRVKGEETIYNYVMKYRYMLIPVNIWETNSNDEALEAVANLLSILSTDAISSISVFFKGKHSTRPSVVKSLMYINNVIRHAGVYCYFKSAPRYEKDKYKSKLIKKNRFYFVIVDTDKGRDIIYLNTIFSKPETIEKVAVIATHSQRGVKYKLYVVTRSPRLVLVVKIGGI
ncbi:MAG: hypothetical protein GXO26_07530, partial [Crenarchaeota archaeon]|nr:hypothetical protein [Thermoproteota archaeon]